MIKQILEELILNLRNLLHTFQSGFQKKIFYFTDFYLSYLKHKILKSFDKSMMTGMILIDLKKAFDTIDHDVLLENYMLLVFRSVM